MNGFSKQGRQQIKIKKGFFYDKRGENRSDQVDSKKHERGNEK